MRPAKEMRDPGNSNAPLAATGGAEPRYKIGDVCRIADVQPYVLRYWESEFPSLAPDRAAPGPRTYSLRELRVIERIKKLLYDEGYTIAGAKKKLEAEAGGTAPEAAAKGEPAGAKEKGASQAKTKGAKTPSEAPTGPREDTEPAPAVTAPIAAIPGAGSPPAPDARVPKALTELREILKILSREP